MRGREFALLAIGFLSSIFLINSVLATDCWLYNTNSTCVSYSDCTWKSDSWGGWCEQLNCWSLNTQDACSTTNVPGKNCSWRGGGESWGCEKLNCWSLSGTSEATCINNSIGISCQWGNSCYNTGGSGNCWNYQAQSDCLNASGCGWGQCMDQGCWSYNTNSTCLSAKDPWNGKNCSWTPYLPESSWCECTLPDCNVGTPNGCSDLEEPACNANSSNGCLWRAGNCDYKGCGYYNANQSYCDAQSGCAWKWDSCQEINCWNWDFTNASACINNTEGLSCNWENSWCKDKGCWSYNTNSTCSNQSSCIWKKWMSSGWCEEVNCWSWDSMNGGNETLCVNNPYNNSLNCMWSGNPPGNSTNGWCYKDMSSFSCSNITTEKACMDTFYCWWQFVDWNNPSSGGNCSDPMGFGFNMNDTMFNEWNPGCYLFDMNQTECENIIGCEYSGGKCVVSSGNLEDDILSGGINCSLINSSGLCNNIPMLSSCCVWQSSSCEPNKFSTSCWDQMEEPPAGAAFCEDYNAYTTQSLCEQIAGSPWYMPCKWDSSTERCGFKSDDVFGNDTQSLVKIDNKKNCEAAGGKWLTENYCEGNISVPTGRCEHKFDEEDNCDKACFACEGKDSDGNTVNSTNAESACLGSKLGTCFFEPNANAPNGAGYCKTKSQFKTGVAASCDSTCGDCTFKGDPNNNDTTKVPSYFCINSKANSEGGGCKWITDNSTLQGGYCINKGDKTCEDACDRCNSQTDCQETGRIAVANQSGSCKWQGDSSTGSCVANVAGDVEICWDGSDNNNNNLIDCFDSGCFADPFCGFVSGDCFGWINNDTCLENNCEWVVDKWGSWCDFKGSRCWNSNQNETVCNSNINCQWTNGSGNGWCENDWSKAEVCMGMNQSDCLASTEAFGCNWSVDTWCLGEGNSSAWCLDYGGWCDQANFASKNCWTYDSDPSACTNASGCSWKTDQYAMPHCEVNYGGNCWLYSNDTSCEASGCWWRSDQWGSWCTNLMDKCWSSQDSTTCGLRTSNGTNICYWDTKMNSCQPLCFNNLDISSCGLIPGCMWKEQSGWCEETSGCFGLNQEACTNDTGLNLSCNWKSDGWCDPKNGGFSTASAASGGGGGSMGGDCYKYDGNQTLCTNSSIINISCGWTVNQNPICEIDWSRDCWRYPSVEAGCNATNGCWFKSDEYGSFCTNLMDQCWNNASYQSWNNTAWAENCSANPYCTNSSWGCEPKCGNLNSTGCTNETYAGVCRYTTGWCNGASTTEMFNGMEKGAPAMLGFDDCPENGVQASVDLCGFGMKDMGNAYGIGAGVVSFLNASVCNKETVSSPPMGPGPAPPSQIGSGTDTVKFLVYLDTDGETSGGCVLDNNSSAEGYEFKLRYSSVWNDTLGKAIETLNSYKCDNSDWKATDIKISAWKKMMCSEISGPMIAIEKADLSKYPTLYDSTADLRIYVTTIGNDGNVSNPTDAAGPGWTTPGSIDFEIQGAFSYGADTSKFEDILKNGFVKGEDCYNSFDDDADGSTDCFDWDCQYSSKCTAHDYSGDTSSPQVSGVKIEEYPDSALIMYDTSKPTNGTLEFYGTDSQCSSLNASVYDVGILKNNTVREYKLWHSANVYNGADSMGYSLENETAYYYKLRICDSNNKCAVSRCSSFKTSSAARCGYCNFVTRIKVPDTWKVSYDFGLDGTYEHIQGEMCGANAGMKTNYTSGRRANVKVAMSDGSTYFEFLNVSLTKTGLNDKVRTISASGDLIYDSVKGLVGLPAESRDKIINNLHPEACRVKIDVPAAGVCDKLYHCNDTGGDCEDKTAAAGGAPVDSANCVWNVPYCEFSAYKTTESSGSGTPGDTGGGGGGGTATNGTGKTYAITRTQFQNGFTRQLRLNERIRFQLQNNESHYVTLQAFTRTSATVKVESEPQTATLNVGDEKKFELTSDGYYDLSAKLEMIDYDNNSTNITVKEIYEAVPAQSQAETTPTTTPETTPDTPTTTPGETTGEGTSYAGIITALIIAIVVIAIAILLVIKFRGKSPPKREK